jgi:hypothetical protein
MLGRREEENPAPLNIGPVGRAALRLSYLASGALRREHKLMECYREAPGTR